MILDEFLEKLDNKIKICQRLKQSDETATYVPYYDSIIEKKARS